MVWNERQETNEWMRDRLKQRRRKKCLFLVVASPLRIIIIIIVNHTMAFTKERFFRELLTLLKWKNEKERIPNKHFMFM